MDYFPEHIESNEDLYEIHLKDFTANGIYHVDYEVGSIGDVRSIVKYLVKGIYREQNNLEEDYGY